MLKSFTKLFTPAEGKVRAPNLDQAALELGVATLLVEMTRMDFEIKPEELVAVRAGLADLFGLSAEKADTLLEEARAKSQRMTSYFAQVSAINRHFSMEQRIRLVEHLWRVAYADAGLDPYEDHLVRKLSHLMYVPHVQCMLARQRARGMA